MQTKISSKGQVVLPVTIRNRLRLKEGDPLEIRIQSDHILLIPKNAIKMRGQVIKDPVSDLPVLTFGLEAPNVTNETITKLLEDFP